jgi:hypothetical protein
MPDDFNQAVAQAIPSMQNGGGHPFIYWFSTGNEW